MTVVGRVDVGCVDLSGSVLAGEERNITAVLERNCYQYKNTRKALGQTIEKDTALDKNLCLSGKLPANLTGVGVHVHVAEPVMSSITFGGISPSIQAQYSYFNTITSFTPGIPVVGISPSCPGTR